MLDPTEFQEGFSRWIFMLIKHSGDKSYAIDGKALRGTAIKGHPNSFIHTVSLWAGDYQLTLRQVKVKDKFNEITAIPQLLEAVDITGATITIDAMGTQTTIAERIIASGADYVFALKGNQSSLHDEIENYFIQAEQVDFEGVDHQSYHMTEEGHGRAEKRSFFVTEDYEKYFKKTGLRQWSFYADNNDDELVLARAMETRIKRYVKIQAKATPYDPDYQQYFRHRDRQVNKQKDNSRINSINL